MKPTCLLLALALAGCSTTDSTVDPLLPARPGYDFRRSSTGIGSDLCLVPATGGEPTRLALPGSQRLPAWSADGTALVCVHHAETADRPDLYRVNLDGTDLSPLVTDELPGGSLHPVHLRRPWDRPPSRGVSRPWTAQASDSRSG